MKSDAPVAADICRVLELHIQAKGKTNTTVALRKVGADEKGLYPIQTLGGTQATAVVSESGL